MLPCTRRVTRHLPSRAARCTNTNTNTNLYQTRVPWIATAAIATSLPAPPLLALCPRGFCVNSTQRQFQAPSPSPAPAHPPSDDGASIGISPPSSSSPRATNSQEPPEPEAERAHDCMPATVHDHVVSLSQSDTSLGAGVIRDVESSPSSADSIESSQDPENIKAQKSRRESSRYIHWLRQLVFASNAAWHELISLLCQLSNHVDHTHGHPVVVTDVFIAHLIGDNRPNKWYQPHGTGSVVRLLPSQYSNSGSRLLLLNGTERAVELAEQQINELQSDFHLQQRHLDPQTALQEPSPPDLSFHSVNSMSTFIQFVIQVTNRYVQSGVRRDSKRSWSQDVASVLILLFQNPATSKFASTVALNEALAFLCKHPELSEEVDILYRCAIALHKGFDTSTANILLAFAFNINDFARAKSLLYEMRENDTPANSVTWSLVFAKTKLELKVRVLELMKETDLLLAPGAITKIRNSVLHGLYFIAKPSLSGLKDLLNKLDTIFGSNWMTLESYHYLLGLCRHRRPPLDSATIQFLQQLPQDRNFSINHQTTTRLMVLDQVHGLTRPTFHSFIRGLRDADYPRMGLAIPLLFRAAWNRCFYNVCHVLWTYAAVCGQISYVMHQIVIRPLTRATPINSGRATRARLGARVIVGVQGWQPVETYTLKALYPKLSAHFADNPNPILWLAQQTPDARTRKEQLSLAHLTLENDVNAWKLFRPMSLEYLEESLQLAYQMDEQWVNDGKVDVKDDAAILELRQQRLTMKLRRLKVGEVNEKVAKRLRQMKVLHDALDVAGEEGLSGDVDENGLLTKGDQSQAARDDNKPWWLL